MEKRWPQGELRIVVHPLEPRKGWPFHVEGSYRQSFLIWRGVVLEELRDLEGPTSWIRTIKPWDVELHTMHWIVRWRRLSCRWRWWRLRWLLVHFELRHTVKEIINLRIHGELRSCEFRNCVFQAFWWHLGARRIRHCCAMKAPMLELGFRGLSNLPRENRRKREIERE